MSYVQIYAICPRCKNGWLCTFSWLCLKKRFVSCVTLYGKEVPNACQIIKVLGVSCLLDDCPVRVSKN